MKQTIIPLAIFGLTLPFLATASHIEDKKPMSDPGKPVNGLVASAQVIERRGGKEPVSFIVNFSLKNTTDKPITICDYVGSMPLDVKWIGPDGKKIESDHYGWLRVADLMPIGAKNFVTIPPGGVRRIGPEGEKSAIVFHTKKDPDQQHGNVAEKGMHRITVTYVNKDDGKKFKLNNVWTGAVTAPEVTFTVK